MKLCVTLILPRLSSVFSMFWISVYLYAVHDYIVNLDILFSLTVFHLLYNIVWISGFSQVFPLMHFQWKSMRQKNYKGYHETNVIILAILQPKFILPWLRMLQLKWQDWNCKFLLLFLYPITFIVNWTQFLYILQSEELFY